LRRRGGPAASLGARRLAAASVDPRASLRLASLGRAAVPARDPRRRPLEDDRQSAPDAARPGHLPCAGSRMDAAPYGRRAVDRLPSLDPRAPRAPAVARRDRAATHRNLEAE